MLLVHGKSKSAACHFAFNSNLLRRLVLFCWQYRFDNRVEIQFPVVWFDGGLQSESDVRTGKVLYTTIEAYKTITYSGNKSYISTRTCENKYLLPLICKNWQYRCDSDSCKMVWKFTICISHMYIKWMWMCIVVHIQCSHDLNFEIIDSTVHMYICRLFLSQ